MFQNLSRSIMKDRVNKKMTLVFRDTWSAYFIFRELWNDRFIFCVTWPSTKKEWQFEPGIATTSLKEGTLKANFLNRCYSWK